MAFYQRTVPIGDEKLTVSYSSKGEHLPYGVYPRRMLSYFTKYITIKKINKVETLIKLPANKMSFIKEVLSIDYIPNSDDMKAINTQLKSFSECLVSINFTNSNETSRKNRKDFTFFNKEIDVSFLWDDTRDWKSEVRLSNDFFELIRNNVVPISDIAIRSFRNSLKLDFLNYLLYQNFNLQRKGINHRFYFATLYEQFGGGSIYSEFKRNIRDILKEFTTTVYLNVQDVTKESFLLVANEESLLKRTERRKTNPEPNAKVQISPEKLEKLEQQYNKVDIAAATMYIEKIITRGYGSPIRNPIGYLKHVINFPHWYYKEKIEVLKLIHKKQQQEFESLSVNIRKSIFNELVSRIKKTPSTLVSTERSCYLQQLKQPGKRIVDIPGIDYIVYMYWASLTDRITQYTDNTEDNLNKLFSELLV